MNPSLSTFFSAFTSSSDNTKSNTQITFDTHIITFTSSQGDIYNLRFKNEIISIYPLLNGIIIKLVQNSNTIPFFSSKKTKDDFTYRNYIITSHPLSSMSPLSISTPNEDTSNDNFTILKSSKKIPFLISKDDTNNKINLVTILYRKNDKLQDFEHNIKKMLNSSFEPFNLGNENSSMYPSEYSFKLIQIFTFDDISYEDGLRCKMFTCYSKKKSLCVSFLNHNSLYVYMIKFLKEISLLSYTVKKYVYPNVIDFCLCDSLISEKNSLLYEVKTKKENNQISNSNIIRNYLENKSELIKNKTLVFLGSEGHFSFIESGQVFLVISISVDFPIKKFTIKNQREFYLYGDNDNYAQINKNLSLNDKNAILLLKFFKMELSDEDIYHLLLTCLYSHITNNGKVNHYSLLCFIITNIIAEIANLRTFKYSYYKSDQENLISNDIERMRYDKNSSVLIKEKLHNRNNIKEIVLNLLLFSKGFFENMKIYNFHNESYTTKVTINFILNLLSIYQDNSLKFKYLEFFANYYHLTFNNSFPLSYTNSATLYSDNEPLLSFIDTNDSKEKYIFNQLHNIEVITSDDSAIPPVQNSLFNFSFSNCFIFSRSDIPSVIDSNIEMKTQNFISKIISSKYSINTIKNIHWKKSLTLLSKISQAKNNPYPFLSQSSCSNSQILSLIDRLDLEKNISSTTEETMENLTSMLYKNQSSDYDSEYYLTKIKFNDDNRIKEANRILSPTRILKVNSSSLSNIVDLSQLETEKFILVYKNLIRQYTSCVGNGAINLNTIKTFPKEILEIKPLNTQCLLTNEETTYNLETNKDLLKDKDFALWAEFHNGVAQSIKLSTENFNNKSYIRNWILFNKPSQPSYEHGGFLFGMGLLKQLDSLYATDVYQYMKGAHDGVAAHDGVTIGILLGRSASKISSMEETLSRTLCLHISFLIPSTLEINISMNIQCSAVIGIGLIYMSTGNRLMTEMLLNQIGKISNNNDKSVDMKHLDSYNLCLGFAIGLINLGMGKSTTNHDLNFEEKLFSFISTSNTSQDSTDTFVNHKQTAPSAYACLSLSYLQSRNAKIASRIQIPDNLYKLETFRPFHLYLAVLTKNLIMWDVIDPSEQWIYSNIPSFIKFLYENSLAAISDDIAYASKINLIEFSQITTCYFYSICAGIMSLAFKFCGTINKEVCDIINSILYNKILKIKVVSDIIIKESTKYNDVNKSAINKTTLDECLCIIAYALSIIMSGSGDLQTFKTLRILRKKVDSADYKNFTSGYSQSINHAIGMLFLGSGGLTFNSHKNSIAFLYISTFPIFSRNINDNEKYLQALRHLYILSCENKIFETRDIKTNKIIRSDVTIEDNKGKKITMKTPVNIGDISKVRKIYMKNCKGYYDMEIEREDIVSNVTVNEIDHSREKDLMKVRVAFIKKKTLFDSDIIISIRMIDWNDQGSILNVMSKIQKWIDDNSERNSIIGIISNIAMDQVNVALRENNHFKVLYMKATLVFLMFYVNTDNTIAFNIINDKLNQLYRTIEVGDCSRFDVFEFFEEFDSTVNKEDDELRFMFECCVEEINEFIKKSLREYYKKDIEHYILLCSSEQIEENVNWNLIQFMKLNHIDYENVYKIVNYVSKEENKEKAFEKMMTEDSKMITEKNYSFICYLFDIINKIH